MEYVAIVLDAIGGNLRWTWRSILFDVPWYLNFFWGLIAISLMVWAGELLFPWRKEQGAFRKDFWLDAGYMFFNFFGFSIAISGFYAIAEHGFNKAGLAIDSLSLMDLSAYPGWVQLLIFFILLDFLQWITHMLLHRIPLFWKFHQIHHSVKEMGFAAHFRFHWMENLLYKPLKTVGLMLLGGFEPEQAYIVHFVAITIGHLNHANIKLHWGPLRYLINNPVMHLYHHAYHLPPERKYGVNFGISLSVWDYLFGTHYVPESGGKIPLGFRGDEAVPQGFFPQLLYGLRGKRSKSQK